MKKNLISIFIIAFSLMSFAEAEHPNSPEVVGMNFCLDQSDLNIFNIEAKWNKTKVVYNDSGQIQEAEWDCNASGSGCHWRDHARRWREGYNGENNDWKTDPMTGEYVPPFPAEEGVWQRHYYPDCPVFNPTTGRYE